MRRQKRRGLLLGLLAFALAITTGLLFTSRIAALERQIGEMQQVVVARAPIAARTLITADMLETRELPRVYAAPSYIQSIADVAGQRVAVVELQPGDIVRQQDVAPTSGLDDGSRAIAIGVNPISVQVDRVSAGSRVDVIVSYETTALDQNGREVKTRRTIIPLQDVEVLAVAGSPQQRRASTTGAEEAQDAGGLPAIFGAGDQPASPGTGALSGPYGLRDSVVVATLKVAPEDAQKLAYADTFASDIRLALRRSDDRAVEPMAPVSEEDFR
jgi:pilus assembly protein CpaB